MTGPADDAEASLPTSDCTVCVHPKAAEIDAGLLGGTPVRATAETFGLSRSAVGRHRTNHLSVQAAVQASDGGRSGERRELRIVDVAGQLATLADQLEAVVALAVRTRKATAATAAMGHLRQVLEAIAKIQSDPDLQAAASKQRMEDYLDKGLADATIRMIDFVLQAFGLGTSWVTGMPMAGSAREQVVAELVAACLQRINSDGMNARFDEIDITNARKFVEQEALGRAARAEEEVQRRVEAELRRRQAQARPALEARELPAIEGSVATWTA